MIQIFSDQMSFKNLRFKPKVGLAKSCVVYPKKDLRKDIDIPAWVGYNYIPRHFHELEMGDYVQTADKYIVPVIGKDQNIKYGKTLYFPNRISFDPIKYSVCYFRENRMINDWPRLSFIHKEKLTNKETVFCWLMAKYWDAQIAIGTVWPKKNCLYVKPINYLDKIESKMGLRWLLGYI